MSQVAIFNDLKAKLQAISGIKHVALFNNQFAKEPVENPFLYPCVFIQMTPDNFQELSKGMQMYDCVITLHIGFESYKDEDIDVLTLKELIFSSLHKKPLTNTSSVLYRVAERQNFDHDNVQVYEQDYRTTVKDFGADQRATTEALITILETPPTILP